VLQNSLFLLYQLFLVVLFFTLSAVLGIGCYMTSLFPGGTDRAHRYLRKWARICLWLTRCQITVEGRERLELGRPYVFMANHASFLDILLLLALVPHDFRFIVKKELFLIPILGLTVKSSAQIALDRKHPKKGLQSIKQAADLLKNGVSIVAFPEGTRSQDGKIHDFKRTLFVLPIRTRTPVVPVLIEGTFQALRSGSVLLRRNPLKVTFLEPVAVDSLSDDDRASYAETVRQHLIISGRNPKPAANMSTR
jgi:1-acyl-sn-glycerol-3-phosphate acyltransferase